MIELGCHVGFTQQCLAPRDFRRLRANETEHMREL